MPVSTDWFFGNRKESYARARKNTAAIAADMRGTSEEDARTALAALDGDESFLLGTLASGEGVRLAAREVGRHGMVWGSSGAGKSYGLVIITNGWSSSGARRLQLIDPKGGVAVANANHARHRIDMHRWSARQHKHNVRYWRRSSACKEFVR
ncbi:MAG TPA: hypothetical protein VGF48_00355 [Thermoanaerobaculia bacterium]|jgi:DNA helicase HerA-like ATPase